MARKTRPARVRNEPLYRAMVAIRQSSAASPHKDARTARARTRSAAKARAIRDFA